MASETKKPAGAESGFANAAKPSGAAARAEPDHGAILRSVGEATYEWQIDSDTLTWDDNATQILGIRDAALIASGRAYVNLLDPGNAQTRFDAVMNSGGKDQGDGVPYHVEYCLRAAPRSEKCWIEDTGRWFAGPDGRPARSHGVIRGISERHARDQELAYLSQFDGLTGEINRWHLSKNFSKARCRIRSARGNPAPSCWSPSTILRASTRPMATTSPTRSSAPSPNACATSMRAEDSLGRFSGNKFGVILRNCSPEEIAVAAERYLAVVRDDVMMTARRAGLGDGDNRRGQRRRGMRKACMIFCRARRKRSIAPRPSGPAHSSPISRISSAKRCARTISARPRRSSPH